jgi:hypothetical protein
MPPIPVVPRSAEIDFELLVQLDDVDQATIAHVPLEIGDHTSETNISVGMPDDAGDEPTDGPAHLRVTTPGFIVPDTAPTPDVLFDNGFRASNDAHEAPTVPARDRGFVPPREPPVPLTPVSIAAPGAPIVRDRPMPRLPLSTAPDSLPPPKDSKVTSGPSPACPQCESPMAWVEEHLRFYCKSCRMYF